jgi:hypothetical protein
VLIPCSLTKVRVVLRTGDHREVEAEAEWEA